MKFDMNAWRDEQRELLINHAACDYYPISSISELFDEIYRLENALSDAQLKPKTVYTVTMYRYGNREWHSYVLGAFSSNDIAREWAAKEEEYRGGKYKAEIIRWGIDSPTDFLVEREDADRLTAELAELRERTRWTDCDNTMIVRRDGGAWCFTLPDFINLVVSPAVFTDDGDTDMDAIYAQLKPEPPEEG